MADILGSFATLFVFAAGGFLLGIGFMVWILNGVGPRF